MFLHIPTLIILREFFINLRAPKITMVPGGKVPEKAISFPYYADMAPKAIRQYIARNAVVSKTNRV